MGNFPSQVDSAFTTQEDTKETTTVSTTAGSQGGKPSFSRPEVDSASKSKKKSKRDQQQKQSSSTLQASSKATFGNGKKITGSSAVPVANSTEDYDEEMSVAAKATSKGTASSAKS